MKHQQQNPATQLSGQFSLQQTCNYQIANLILHYNKVVLY